MAEKVEILAEQYPGLPKSQIENCLYLYDGDLDTASADLLTKKFEDDARVSFCLHIQMEECKLCWERVLP